MTDNSKRDREIIPVVEEQAVVLKHKKLTEGVRVRTVVHEDDEVVNELLTTEEVEVERTTLDRWVDAAVPIRQEGETTIITLVEEVVVVEKRLRATEELRITKQKSIRREPQRVTLRREDVVVERLRATRPNEDDPQ
jgi:stress response protein YsnF